MMTCTRLSCGAPARPRRKHAERVLCDACAALPQVIRVQDRTCADCGLCGSGVTVWSNGRALCYDCAKTAALRPDLIYEAWRVT